MRQSIILALSAVLVIAADISVHAQQQTQAAPARKFPIRSTGGACLRCQNSRARRSSCWATLSRNAARGAI